MIEIKIDTRQLESLFDRLAKATAKPAPLMRQVADIMLEAVEDNFAQEGRPHWQGLKPGSLLSRAGALTKTGNVSNARFEKHVRNAKILQASGRLAGSIVQSSDNTTASVGSNVKYAAIHQFGGQTKPHLIVARNKKALAWATGRGPVKSVQHPGSKIPARPFLMLSPEDESEIEFTVSDYLRQVIAL